MLQVASAAGDSMPCLFLQAHDNDATPQLVSCQLGSARLPLCVCVPATVCVFMSLLAGFCQLDRTVCTSLLADNYLPHSHCCLPPGRLPACLQAEEIGEACSQLAVKLPVAYTLRPGAALYQAVVQTAQQPELAIPETPSLKVGDGVVVWLWGFVGGMCWQAAWPVQLRDLLLAPCMR